MAIILAPRCGRFPWTLNHQGFAFDRWIQCWIRKSGCVCPINPAMTGRKPSPTTAPPFFGLAKSRLLPKEPQEAPRESQCVQRIFTPERECSTTSSSSRTSFREGEDYCIATDDGCLCCAKVSIRVGLRTEDFAIPGPAGKFPVRLYVPHMVILSGGSWTSRIWCRKQQSFIQD